MGLMSATASAANAASRQLKVMIVDDSVVIRGLISRWINEDPTLEIAGSHRNGRLAVEDVAKSRPDIIILDIEMPDMDGLTALPLLLKSCPSTKIIMASTLTRRNAEISLRALSLGATDYVPKPESNSEITTSKSFRTELLDKVKAIGGISEAAAPQFRASRGGPAARGRVASSGCAPSAKSPFFGNEQGLWVRPRAAAPARAAAAIAGAEWDFSCDNLNSARPRALC